MSLLDRGMLDVWTYLQKIARDGSGIQKMPGVSQDLVAKCKRLGGQALLYLYIYCVYIYTVYKAIAILHD